MAGRGRETAAKSDGEASVCAVVGLIDNGAISFAVLERNDKLKSEVRWFGSHQKCQLRLRSLTPL